MDQEMNNPVLIIFNTVPGKQRQKKEKMQWTTCDALQLSFCCVYSQTARRKSVAMSSTFATSRRRKSTSKDSEPSASVSRAERWICNLSACVVWVSVVCEMWCVSDCCMWVCVTQCVSVVCVCEWVLYVCVCVIWCVSALACQQLNELVNV